ncbi:MAG: PilZ domain-containing protein [Myxococcota bacterium]
MRTDVPELGIMGRRIGFRIGATTFAPRVLEALRALGYTLVDLDAERVAPAIREGCGLWLVDLDRLATLPSSDDAPDKRILLVASPRAGTCEDPRVFASVQRPARLGAVYEMIQSALESTPRSAPRVRTRLSARCIRGDQRSIGALLSLSEGGCLLRSGESLARGATLRLQFALPDHGLISTRAECRYARAGDAGLAFADSAGHVRHTISHFVTEELAAAARARAGARSDGGSLSA